MGKVILNQERRAHFFLSTQRLDTNRRTAPLKAYPTIQIDFAGIYHGESLLNLYLSSFSKKQTCHRRNPFSGIYLSLRTMTFSLQMVSTVPATEKETPQFSLSFNQQASLTKLTKFLPFGPLSGILQRVDQREHRDHNWYPQPDCIFPQRCAVPLLLPEDYG